ncbi:PTS lactose/cellobiose transporter subunit IIA [Enterococcus devriesei]|uniref:PTS lactose/cellobiose transporter subunit IIA n=1 Tax=Enterococcus TaxID=1350 RepID=UPI00288E504B|nr:PTS lactose/cellobiose transporter subunit IIA [Enterococcus devriesei]MDT2822375.1 PTS lactose/cellobiose transporter subunit IIA [Enterococcus devriesei]
MTKEEVQLTAFQIISIAGDAMDDFYQGLSTYLDGVRLDSGIVAMKRGQERMAEVHNIQTKLIKAEVNEEEVPYSLIMTHAQDHLANAISWSRMCQLLIDQLEREEVETYE